MVPLVLLVLPVLRGLLVLPARLGPLGPPEKVRGRKGTPALLVLPALLVRRALLARPAIQAQRARLELPEHRGQSEFSSRSTHRRPTPIQGPAISGSITPLRPAPPQSTLMTSSSPALP